MGDIESMPFIEAFRQFQFKVKRENFCNIHVSLVPQVRFQKAIPCSVGPKEPGWLFLRLWVRISKGGRECLYHLACSVSIV